MSLRKFFSLVLLAGCIPLEQPEIISESFVCDEIQSGWYETYRVIVDNTCGWNPGSEMATSLGLQHYPTEITFSGTRPNGCEFETENPESCTLRVNQSCYHGMHATGTVQPISEKEFIEEYVFEFSSCSYRSIYYYKKVNQIVTK